jgi:ribose transport system substrate-binding protein
MPLRPTSCLASCLAVLALAALSQQLTAGDGPLSIAVIPKGTTHEFWKAIHAGAVKASRELPNVRIIWKGPIKEDDRTAQIDVVQTFVGQGVSGLVLAPLDRKALARPVEQAVKAGLPVVVIDSGLDSEAPVSVVATDNVAGGRLGGERLAKLLGGTGKILLLRYQAGSASTEQREAGFLEAVKAYPNLTLVSSDQYAGATRETALNASQNLLNKYGSELAGIFTPNESSTAGMAKALKDLKLNGKLKHVGFDASPVLIEGLKAGDINGLVVQDPFQMGYLGVTTLVKHLRGQAIAKKTDTPVQLVTPENCNDPAIQQLLNPPLKEFLGE